MPRARLGVALLLPEPVRTEVDALRRAVGDGSLGRVPAHLTLVPPVNVNERDLDAAFTLLRDAAAASGPMTLELGPPASFLPQNPVLYLEVGGAVEALLALRERVFRPPLHRELAWPYVPHVTLCDEGDPERLSWAVESLADFRAPVTLTHVHILNETEKVWRPFADAVLGGRRVVGRGGLELEITESEHQDPDAAAFDARVRPAQDEADFGGLWRRADFALTARRSGQVVGTAVGWTQTGVADLLGLIVDPQVRGQGVGAHLLAAFEDVARRRGCTRLALRTAEGLPARAFYEARGWRVEARLEDWLYGRAFLQLRKDL